MPSLVQSGSDSAMRASGLLAATLLCVFGTCVRADGASSPCDKPTVKSGDLRRVACVEQDDVTIERYSGSPSQSPYATEFDVRSVTVARSASSERIFEAAGVTRQSKESLPRTRLAQPPLADQVLRRAALTHSTRFRQWALWTEQVEYGAQGGWQGFTMDCVTAIRRRIEQTVAVAECFPVEERQRFLAMLENIQ